MARILRRVVQILLPILYAVKRPRAISARSVDTVNPNSAAAEASVIGSSWPIIA
jgi:hypothetical protein